MIRFLLIVFLIYGCSSKSDNDYKYISEKEDLDQLRQLVKLKIALDNAIINNKELQDNINSQNSNVNELVNAILDKKESQVQVLYLSDKVEVLKKEKKKIEKRILELEKINKQYKDSLSKKERLFYF